MIACLILPRPLREQIAREALAAYPAECCGLIEGVRNKEEAHALACHPTANLAPTPDRFEIDPARHIALLRALRGTGREIIGCYHSHPNGRAGPSPRDLQGAQTENFIWLIAAGTELEAFVYSQHHFHIAELKRE